MNKEEMTLLEMMIEEVADLTLGDISDVDAIWDKYYNRLIEMTVDENCNDNSTCGEEIIHDEMADFRVMFYDKADEYSCKCDRCMNKIYGKNTEERICKGCKD